jgi:hypothetical protein
MNNSERAKIIILGIDGLEYNLVKEWLLKNIMQKTYCKLDLSDYTVIATPPIWGSMLTGKIDYEVMKSWVKRAEVLGVDEKIQKKWWTNIERILPASLNWWIWYHIITPIIGGDPFATSANYVKEKNETTIFHFFKKPWTNEIPGYGRNVSTSLEKKLAENAITGKSKAYRKHILDQYKIDKSQLLSALDNQEYDIIFWYTPLIDNFGHMDMGKPVRKMMKHYLEINEVVGIVKESNPLSNIYIISDHGMEEMEPKSTSWGMHSRHGFFSSSTGEKISKPFHLYNLITTQRSS